MTKKMVLLLAHSARSVAYVQALSNAKISPSAVVVYGNNDIKLSTKRELQHNDGDIFCPDLSLNLTQSLALTEWPVWHCDLRSLDNPALLTKLKELAPDIIVYSGYGGQIVPKRLLDIAPTLHIHSGLLPDFPGSTTIYYQMLSQKCCGASAILLDETIDTGPVIAKKTYPSPPKQLDIDYLYDTMIRADLLVEVLRKRDISNLHDDAMIQSSNRTPYYIIHPLLKHLAILWSDHEAVKEGSKVD
ncbi:formyltransferase family protein [Alteromonas ponticola]|uniref:Methionyl-tRNA formyltransferase n=1 Tax=Alteromonas ponticola TaxID=2720613 RepID=A0ABX1R2B8_9ALTE|nr:formyltransferase family protein [Alteromonas ponticola]NMH59637.1 methionyl-tRNA formyltransferase [Alteromonas ponticola]